MRDFFTRPIMSKKYCILNLILNLPNMRIMMADS